MTSINDIMSQHTKWYKNGLRNAPNNGIHDVVLCGDILKSVDPFYIEQFSRKDVQIKAKEYFSNIQITEDSKLGYFWTAVKSEVERKYPGSTINAPHWRGFSDTTEVKDCARNATKFVVEFLIRIVDSLNSK